MMKLEQVAQEDKNLLLLLKITKKIYNFLFLVFFNDFPNFIMSKLILFADDSTRYVAYLEGINKKMTIDSK